MCHNPFKEYLVWFKQVATWSKVLADISIKCGQYKFRLLQHLFLSLIRYLARTNFNSVFKSYYAQVFQIKG
jgi:hypothetical protein